MSNKFKLIESTNVLQTKAFTVVRDKIELPNKKLVVRNVVRHPGAAVFIPRLENNLYLLVRQYRHAVEMQMLEFPAGTLEIGEDALTCAKREIVEETGYRAGNWQSLGQLYPAPGFCDEKQYLYFASELTPSHALADEDEFIEVIKLSGAEIERAIVAGDICDAKSISIFFMARQAGLV